MAASTYPGTTRKPIFIEDDDDLASLLDLEAGFSGYHHSLFTKSSSFNALKRRGSYRVLPSSTVSPKIYAARYEDNHQPHFLEACSLCKKPLGDNRDIFMYRGDTPFCSEECRQEQIEIDEAKEKKWNLSASMKPLRVDHNKSTPNKNQNYPVRTGTVAVS